jgi:hypothetical protein
MRRARGWLAVLVARKFPLKGLTPTRTLRILRMTPANVCSVERVEHCVTITVEVRAPLEPSAMAGDRAATYI